MRITRKQLRKIIREQLESNLDKPRIDLKKYSASKRKALLDKMHSLERYPGTHDAEFFEDFKNLQPNPYGGRYHFMFEPGSSKPGSGFLSIFMVEPQTGDMEFQNAYEVESLSAELRKLTKK